MSGKTPEQIRQESLEQLKELRPIDDIFMREMFRNNKELTEFVLRTITGISDLEVIEEHSQYDLQRLLGARSICLDVFAKDSAGRWYNLEVQRSEKGAEPKRARYHSSSIDVEILDTRAKFNDLPITYVIFVTEKDVFGENKLIYPIERINTATGKPFGDDEHIIYVNGGYINKGDNSDLAKLMHDFLCSNADDMLLPLMAESTRYYKTNPKGVEHMAKNMTDWGNELRQEALIETAIKMISKGKLTLEEVAEYSSLPLDKIRELAEKNKPVVT